MRINSKSLLLPLDLLNKNLHSNLHFESHYWSIKSCLLLFRMMSEKLLIALAQLDRHRRRRLLLLWFATLRDQRERERFVAQMRENDQYNSDLLRRISEVISSTLCLNASNKSRFINVVFDLASLESRGPRQMSCTSKRLVNLAFRLPRRFNTQQWCSENLSSK